MGKKPLFLSAASALIFSNYALAADSVIVEPEPTEYVRVCDAYGSGFFYIPGTETCIRFSGFVRSAYEKFDIDVDTGSQLNGALFPLFAFPPIDEFNFAAWGTRARLNIDTRNETDWGTLRAIYRLEAGQSNTDSDIDMDVALISLAGFRAGYSGANYWSSNHDFGWVNAEAVGFNAAGIVADDGFYGFDDGTVFDYTFAENGFAITVGIEDPGTSYGRDNFGNTTNNGGTDSRVNYYAGINYSASWGGISFTAAHDSIAPKIETATFGGFFTGHAITDTGGWAYKVSANLNLSDYISGGSVWGMYMYDGDYNTDYVHANGLLENPDSAWGVAYQMDLTDEVEFWVNYWDVDGGKANIFNGPGLPTFNFFGSNIDFIAGTAIDEGGVRQFGVGLNWYPKAAKGFHVKASYFRGEVDNTGHILVCNGFFTIAGPQGCSFDYDGYTVSLRRDF
ncbi:MAG: porin [Rhizobiaceae bacterium]